MTWKRNGLLASIVLVASWGNNNNNSPGWCAMGLSIRSTTTTSIVSRNSRHHHDGFSSSLAVRSSGMSFPVGRISTTTTTTTARHQAPSADDNGGEPQQRRVMKNATEIASVTTLTTSSSTTQGQTTKPESKAFPDFYFKSPVEDDDDDDDGGRREAMTVKQLMKLQQEQEKETQRVVAPMTPPPPPAAVPQKSPEMLAREEDLEKTVAVLLHNWNMQELRQAANDISLKRAEVSQRQLLATRLEREFREAQLAREQRQEQSRRGLLMAHLKDQTKTQRQRRLTREFASVNSASTLVEGYQRHVPIKRRLDSAPTKSTKIMDSEPAMVWEDAQEEQQQQEPASVPYFAVNTKPQKEYKMVEVQVEKILPNVSPLVARDAWMSYTWEKGGGLPTASMTTKGDQDEFSATRVLLPSLLQEEMVVPMTTAATIGDGDGDESSRLMVLYKLQKAGVLSGDIIVKAHGGQVSFESCERGTKMVWKVRFGATRRHGLWKDVTNTLVGLACDNLASYLAPPMLIQKTVPLPGTTPREAMDAWTQFVFADGGGLPIPFVSLGENKRLVVPPFLVESIEDINYDRNEIIYQVKNPGLLTTYPVHSHMGVVRFMEAKDPSQPGNVVTTMEWNVEVRPFHNFRSYVKAYTSFMIITLAKNLGTYLVEGGWNRWAHYDTVKETLQKLTATLKEEAERSAIRSEELAGKLEKGTVSRAEKLVNSLSAKLAQTSESISIDTQNRQDAFSSSFTEKSEKLSLKAEERAAEWVDIGWKEAKENFKGLTPLAKRCEKLYLQAQQFSSKWMKDKKAEQDSQPLDCSSVADDAQETKSQQGYRPATGSVGFASIRDSKSMVLHAAAGNTTLETEVLDKELEPVLDSAQQQEQTIRGLLETRLLMEQKAKERERAQRQERTIRGLLEARLSMKHEGGKEREKAQPQERTIRGPLEARLSMEQREEPDFPENACPKEVDLEKTIAALRKAWEVEDM